MYVIFASYGNDSIALIQWFKENVESTEVIVAYSNTHWSGGQWEERVQKAREWVHTLGYKTHEIPSEGMEALVRRKKGWPSCRRYQFCTEQLKILPAQRWLDKIDPEKEATCVVGVRREESRERQRWPEWLEHSDKHGGRELWSPLVRHTQGKRDALLSRTPFLPLPHRSLECFPCICSNRGDLRQLTEARVSEIEALEHSLGYTSKGKPRTMFRPYRHMGAVGVREVWRWAMSDRGKYKPPVELGSGSGCDSGFCGG